MFPKIMVPPNHPILIGFSIINHPFWGTPIFGNIHIFFLREKRIFWIFSVEKNVEPLHKLSGASSGHQYMSIKALIDQGFGAPYSPTVPAFLA